MVEAAVVVTNTIKLVSLSMVLFATVSQHAMAAVLPEERIDIMYATYEGDNQDIVAPAILVRKNFAAKVSIQGHYLVDLVSGASIDVRTLASPYKEERTEISLGMDYLRDRTIMGLSYIDSSENDYESETISFNISQEFFGDLSTLALGYSQGDDLITAPACDGFGQEEKQSKRFRASFTQILTRSWITTVNFESIIDEGYLNNAYLDCFSGVRTVSENRPENNPNTRNSDALSIRSLYYLPYRASIRLEYRIYEDSWGIKANNYELRYIHPFNERLFIELKYRAYTQDPSKFYADLFDETNENQIFVTRDKELSDFSNQTAGIKVSYDATNLSKKFLPFFDKSILNFNWDRMQFDYNNFRDRTQGGVPGEEPLFNFDADLIRFSVSLWY